MNESPSVQKVQNFHHILKTEFLSYFLICDQVTITFNNSEDSEPDGMKKGLGKNTFFI